MPGGGRVPEEKPVSKIRYSIDVTYDGHVDMVKFYSRVDPDEYWSDRITADLHEWSDDPDEPHSRASGYVYRYLLDRVEDGFIVGSGYDGVHQSAFSGEPDLSMGNDGFLGEDEDPDWLELVAAYPWIAKNPNIPDPNVPEEWQPRHPGGTAELDFG